MSKKARLPRSPVAKFQHVNKAKVFTDKKKQSKLRPTKYRYGEE